MRLIVTGTDTGVGKTIFAAGLAGALGAAYWKPIQAGLEDASDTAMVAALAPAARCLPEAYRLRTPCSPHRAAEIDEVRISPEALTPPALDPLVIEGAGGALVPVTRDLLYADLFARWKLPVVIVARTGLGTISHSLMTIEALRHRRVEIVGIAFVGDAVEDSEATIAAMGRVKRLGRLPLANSLDAVWLKSTFAEAFDLGDFA